MMHNITIIPGDGIGPEVSGAARACVEAAAQRYGFDVEWDEEIAGATALKEEGDLLPKRTLDSIRRNKVALKGPITTPVGEGFRSVNVEMRKRLDLYANVRPIRSFRGVESRYSGVDLVIVRENTEDLYSGIEFGRGSASAREIIRMARLENSSGVRSDSSIALKTISSSASRRIASFAFEYAKGNRRRRVTAVHKANIMKLTDGLFLEEARRASKRFPKIRFDDMIVDNLSMHLVLDPTGFDMLLCPNLYGDILSDMCAGLVGGLGLAPGGNIGEKYAVFEPIHGSAPKHAGKGDVNPSASILSAAMMLRHIGEGKAAGAIEKAVASVVASGKTVTYDIKRNGRPASTRAMTEAIIRALR